MKYAILLAVRRLNGKYLLFYEAGEHDFEDHNDVYPVGAGAADADGWGRLRRPFVPDGATMWEVPNGRRKRPHPTSPNPRPYDCPYYLLQNHAVAIHILLQVPLKRG